MAHGTSPLSVPLEHRTYLKRILAAAETLFVFALIAVLAGLIFFHVLVEGRRRWPVAVDNGPFPFWFIPVTSYPRLASHASLPAKVWRVSFFYFTQDERIFDAAVFLGSILLLGLLLLLRRVAFHMAERRLIKLASAMQHTELKMGIELRAKRLEVIATVAQVVLAMILLLSIYLTWRNLSATREGQISDRLSRAIDQLGAADKNGFARREIRLGGIHVLSRIAQESEKDYQAIRQIMNEYVRANALWRNGNSSKNEGHSHRMADLENVKPRSDIQAALDFIAHPQARYKKNLTGVVDFSNTDLRGANFFLGDLEDADLKGSHLEGANLERANLKNADMQSASLQESYLRGTDLEGAGLQEANLEGADLREADLREANLDGADLERADLGKSNLIGAHLNRTNLEGANLSEAFIQEGDLTSANLKAADLTWAHLERANLDGADLSNADLKKADLKGANLEDADLSRCFNLTQAQLDLAGGNEKTKLPSGIKGRGDPIN